MKDTHPFYPSHYNPNTNKYQSNSDHLRETGFYGRKKCSIPALENMIEIGGDLHDAGKGCGTWKQYFEESLKNPGSVRKKEDHSTAGGQIIEQLIPRTAASVMLQTAIYSHHGLQDSVSIETDKHLTEQRKRKAESLSIDECCDSFYAAFDKEKFQALAERAREDASMLLREIQAKLRKWGNRYGCKEFYLGMFERMLISLLIDADRRSTEDFMTGEDIFSEINVGDARKEWDACAEYLENYLAERFPESRGINLYKKKISEQCREAATKTGERYLLSVPTGSGKTLAGLRFAVHHAKTYGKRRIIYVAPFQSITEQNAEEIRRALGREDIVLEHHCSIVPEDDEEQAKYDRLTEDWQVPVIVTTAVQFLNTMFAEKTGNIRRFHSLCDSVILVDEVQALPVRVLGLFNLGMNFLTEFAGTTVVLCTATQPLLEELSENRLLPSRQMVSQTERYDEQFHRMEITDDTELVTGGMDADELAAYIMAKANEYSSVLFIGNTKNCVRTVYDKVTELCRDSGAIWHLSTSMIPVNRQQVLGEIKECSEERRNRCREEELHICISTQLIEAGVDVSFDCVIRSLAGLDSVIQAAGRCNRYSDIPMGHVFIVKTNDKLEKLSRLPDIRKAQDAMSIVLRQFKKAPDTLDGRLDSRKAIKMYYQQYFIKRESEMSYPVTVGGVPTTLVQMLSGNEDLLGSGQKGRPVLGQAFKTAGENFRVIDEEGKFGLVVELDDTVKSWLSQLENRDASLNEKKKIMRKLQPYTVSVSQYLLDKLKPGICYVCDDRIMVLDRRYYNEKTGVSVEPAFMETLIS